MHMRLLSLAVLAACTTAARADSVTFTLSNPNQTAMAGSTLYFGATTSGAAGNTGTELLNGLIETFMPTVPASSIDDGDYFYSSYALSVDPGQSASGTLFSFLVPTNAIAGTVFNGSISLLGGSTSSSLNTLARGTVQVTVAPQAAAVTPEPSSLVLLGTALAALAMVVRRRVCVEGALQVR